MRRMRRRGEEEDEEDEEEDDEEDAEEDEEEGAGLLVLGPAVEEPVVAPGRPHHPLVQARRVQQVPALHPQIVPAGFLIWICFQTC